MATTQSFKRLDIVGMRCVAALSIVFFHFGVPYTGGGFVGVDVFFVISGYLITGLLLKDIELGRFSANRFFVGRVRRILPAYFVMILITFVVAALLMAPNGFASVSKSTIAATLNVSNWFFAERTDYFDQDAASDPLLHTWSLGVEWQFYLVWPLFILMLGHRWRLVGILAVSVCSLVAAELYLRINPSQAFYWPTFRVFEFGTGALLAVRPVSISGRYASIVCFAGLTAVLAAIVTFKPESPLPGFLSLVPCVGTAAMIASRENFVSDYLLSNRLAVWIGQISYSLYLVHWPVVVFATYVAMRDLSGIETTAAIAVCLLLAQYLYRFVERPYHSKEPISGLVFAALAVGLASLVVMAATATSGWAWRNGVSDKLSEAKIDAASFHKAYFGGNGCPRICETTPDAPRKLYVIGDSHARSFYAGAGEAGSDVNVIFVTADACSVFLPELSRQDAWSPSCETTKTEIARRLSADDGDVVLIQYWSQAFGDEYFNLDGEKQSLDEDALVQRLAEYLVWVRSQAPSHHVLVAGDTPGFHARFSPFECLSRPLLKPVGCDASARNNPRLKIVDAVNEKIRRIVPLGAWIDPFDILCGSDGLCRNLTPDGLPIYSDPAHLSVWGSRYLFPITVRGIGG